MTKPIPCDPYPHGRSPPDYEPEEYEDE